MLRSVANAEPSGTDGLLTAFVKAVALGAVIAFCCWVSILMSQPGSLSPIWIASGVLAGVLITSARNTWRSYVFAAFVGNVLARLLSADPWHVALGRGFASSLDAVMVAFAILHFAGGAADPAKVKRIVCVAAISTVVATALSGAIAALVQVAFGTSSFHAVFVPWFVSHSLGMVIFATLTVIARTQGMRLLGRPGHRIDLVASTAFTGLVCLAVFAQSRYSMLFLVYPPLLLCVFRHRFLGVVLGVTLVMAIATAATLAGHGPFWLIPNAEPAERILLLQVFLATTCMLVLPIATVLTERGVLVHNLRESELALSQNQRRLRAIADNLPALVVHVDTDERYTFANAHAGIVLGIDPAHVTGRRIRDVLGPAYYAEVKPHVDAALGGQTSRFETDREFGGAHYHYQTVLVPDTDPDGKIGGFYVMSSDITQLKCTEQELAMLARYDALTGLANRFHFNESADLALARHRRNERSLALLYLDIDYFKQINDSLGHAIGDQVLAEFAQRLKGCLRVTDFAARLGGDEFVVLVEDAEAPETAELLARKMITAMKPAIFIGGKELHVTTSIGIAFCRSATASRDQLVQTADKALYQAKAAGRDTFRTLLVNEPATVWSRPLGSHASG